MLGSKDNKAKLSKEEIKAKKLADAEAKKAAKAEKAAEAKAKNKAKATEKKVDKSKPKENSKNNKSNSKVNELSDIAKEYNIRISTPKGYYPDDVDPIITRLRKEVNELTLDNKKLRDEIGQLEVKNRDLSTELTSLKLQISITDIPVSLDDSLSNLSQLGNINGNDYNDDIPELANSLLNDDEEPKPPKSIKPKIKLNMNGGNT